MEPSIYVNKAYIEKQLVYHPKNRKKCSISGIRIRIREKDTFKIHTFLKQQSLVPANLVILAIIFISLLHSVNSLSFTKGEKLFLSESKLNISYTGLENVYEIEDEYLFYVPEVSVKCECACTVRNKLYCSQNSEQNEINCGMLNNSTTTCTNYDSFGTDKKICPDYYRMCCQTYFSENTMMNRYKAFHLKYQKSTLNFKIDLGSESNARNIAFSIDEEVKYLLINTKYIFQILDNTFLRLLPNKWYFMEDGGTELRVTDKINTRTEESLDKLGWFKFKERRKRLFHVPMKDLNERLRVYPSDCKLISSNYDWNLNALGYAKKGILKFSEHTSKVSEMYKNTILNILVKHENKLTVVKGLNSPVVNISLIKANSFPFIFTSDVILFQPKNSILHLKFLKGNFRFHVEVRNSDTINKWSFTTENINASYNHPIFINYSLPFIFINSPVVCVYQEKQQLCHFPPIITEASTKTLSSTSASTFYLDIERKITSVSFNKTENQSVTQDIRNPISFYIGSSLFIIMCISTLIILIRRKSRKKKKINEMDAEMEPLNNGNSNMCTTKNVENFISEAMMQKISTVFIYKADIIQLARYLDLDEEIDEIESLYQKYNKNKIIYQILNLWKTKAKNESTLSKFIKILHEMDKQDIVEKLFLDTKLKIQEVQKIIFRNNQENKWSQEQIKNLERLFVREEPINKQNRINGKEEINEENNIFLPVPQFCEKSIIKSFLSDWAVGVPYISDKFDLVFPISLSNYKQCSEIELLSYYEGVTGTVEEKLETIKSLGHRVLFLFDGIHNVNNELNEKIYEIIYRNDYANVTKLFFIKENDFSSLQITFNKTLKQLEAADNSNLPGRIIQI